MLCCPRCTVSVRGEKALSLHLREHFPTDPTKLWVCSKCPDTRCPEFSLSLDAMATHYRGHRKKQSQPGHYFSHDNMAAIVRVFPPEPTLVCPRCPVTVPDEKSFLDHLSKHYSTPPTPVWACSGCDKTCLSKEAIASHYTSCTDGTLEEDEDETLLSSEEEDVPKEFHQPASEASTRTPVAPSGSHCGSPWPLMVDASSQTTTQLVDASTQTTGAVAEASVLTVKSPVPAALDSDSPLRTLSPGVPAYPSVGALPAVPPYRAPAQLPVPHSPSPRGKRANLETPVRPASPVVRRAL